MQNIEGMPPGTKVTQFLRNKCLNVVEVVIEPDNIYGVLDLNRVAIPEGYKRADTDWFRVPQPDEFYVSGIDGSAAMMTYRSSYEGTRRIILEPIKQTQYVFTIEYIISKETAEELWQYPDAERDRRFTQRRSKPLTTRIHEREI